MTTATPAVAGQGIARHSRVDALLLVLAACHGVLLLCAPLLPVIALGLWWNSNTIAHNFIHRPFFRGRALNSLFSLYLSALLGIPQSVWRTRHLAHHAGTRWRLRLDGQTVAEVVLILALWSALLALRPAFFLGAYLPGYLLGLGLCLVHGHYEHSRGTVSHYGTVYNALFFNDGYHAEHHARPGLHWSLLPGTVRPGAAVSRWPAVLRWLEALSLDGLEGWVLRSPRLQRLVLRCHEKAFRRLLPAFAGARRVCIVGGGLFPRTLLVLRRLLPQARFVVIDRSADNLATARGLAGGEVEFWHESYHPARAADFDLAVFPLAFVGDREAIYRNPPARCVVVHDWIWHVRGPGTVVSVLLLKRLNLVQP